MYKLETALHNKYLRRDSGKDHTFHVGSVMREFVIRNDLTIHIQLSDPTADKLGCLRAEIKNNKFLVHAIMII